MADLSVKYAGLTFKNPLICGSGPNTDSVEMVKAASDAGFGGVVLKSMGYRGWARPLHLRATPRFRVMNRLDYNLRWQQKHGLDNMGIITAGEGLSLWSDQYLEFINDCKRAAGEDMLVGASVIASATDPGS